MRRRRTSGAAIISLIAAVSLLLFLQLKLDIHWGARAEALRQKISLTAKNPSTDQETEKASAPSAEVNHPTLSERLTLETEKVGRLTDSPDAIEHDLNDWGKSLTEKDVHEIRTSLFSEKLGGDRRALSLDLLGRSDLAEAQSALVDYVLNSPHSSPSEQAAFQLLALDGLIGQSARSKNPAALRQVQRRSTDTLVTQRSAQALRALEGKGPWPEETDQQALTELLEKSQHN